MPRMGVSKEQLTGVKPVPNGLYTVQLTGFEPKKSKNGDSINLNPVLKIVNHQLYNGQRIFDNLNTKAAFYWNDFAHAFGMELEEHPTGSGGEMEPYLPGGPDAFVPDASDPDDVTKWKYVGPLVGKTADIEVLFEHPAGSKPRNKIKQWICAIKDCATKFPDVTHNTNLAK